MAGRIGYYGGIVKDGLVLDLDAAKLDSYPRTGTSWRDVSGNGNNGTLINGPTFNSDNGGSIVFDGTNDYVNGPIQDSILYALCIWVKIITYKVGGGLLGGGGNVDIYLQLGGGNTWQFFNSFVNGNGPTLGQWAYVVGVRGATLDYLYVNGSLISSTTKPNSNTLGTSYVITKRENGSLYTNCNVGLVQIYNKELYSQEVLQNYNATKIRYGL